MADSLAQPTQAPEQAAIEKVAIVDACIFLEYRSIREIDWRKLCGANRVRLILTIPVLNALDKFKSDPRRQQRASRALAEIRSLWDGGNVVREGVILESLPQSVRKEEFHSGCDPDSDDDHIILLLTNYKNSHSGVEVFMATEDGGMELKCRARNIPFICPDA